MAGKNEVIFDLDAPAFSSDDFRMFEFKVKRCPRVIPHDWACCPFSHANEKAKRRDPRLCKYSGTACPEFRRMCSEVLDCKRRVCFFAHTEDELRRPMDDATWMQQHGNMLPEELREAAGMMGPEQAARQPDIMSGLLNKQTNSPAHIAAQGLIPAVHAPGTPAAAAQNQAWPVLQQLAANGQIDAAQLLQLVAAMGNQQPASGSNTPTKSATPESTLAGADLASTLAGMEAGARERASSTGAAHAAAELASDAKRVGSWGSDGASALSDALVAGAAAAQLLPTSLDATPSPAAALVEPAAATVQVNHQDILNLVHQLDMQAL